MFKKSLLSLVGSCIFSAVMFSLFTSTSCTKKSATEVVHDTTTQNIFLCYLRSYSDAILLSDPIADPAQSEVKLKWDSQERVFPEKVVYPGYVYFTDTLELSAQEDYTVELASNVGDCSGEIAIPGALSILQPHQQDTLPLSNNVYCEWGSVSGASFYDVYYSASGYDGSGGYIGSCEFTEKFVASTSYTIPASYFDVPGAAYYDADLHVTPHTGPFPEAGASGNMSGSICGFLTGTGEGDWTCFYVGTPTVKAERSVEKLPLENRIDAYVKALGIDKTAR